MGNFQSSLSGELKQQEEGESDISTFTCEICIEPVLSSNKFKILGKKFCKHPFCVECISKYIEFKVKDNISEIKCPDPNCEVVLDPLACRSILPDRVFVQWCDVLCESVVLKLERVYCPYPQCSTSILNECGGNVTESECPNCKKPLCFKCKIPWHSDYMCEEMEDKNDVLFDTLAELKKWKRCPNCNHFVERDTGCFAVKCRCGTIFCYGCGRACNSQMCFCKKGWAHSTCVLFIMIVLLPLIIPVLILWLIFSSLVPRRLKK